MGAGRRPPGRCSLSLIRRRWRKQVEEGNRRRVGQAAQPGRVAMSHGNRTGPATRYELQLYSKWTVSAGGCPRQPPRSPSTMKNIRPRRRGPRRARPWGRVSKTRSVGLQAVGRRGPISVAREGSAETSKGPNPTQIRRQSAVRSESRMLACVLSSRQRPVGDAVAVGETPSARVIGPSRAMPGRPRSSQHPASAHQIVTVRLALWGGSLVDALGELELRVSRPSHGAWNPERGHTFGPSDSSSTANARTPSCLPFQLERHGVSSRESTRSSDGPLGTAQLLQLLEASRSVHGVTRHHRLARLGVNRLEHLAAVHAELGTPAGTPYAGSRSRLRRREVEPAWEPRRSARAGRPGERSAGTGRQRRRRCILLNVCVRVAKKVCTVHHGSQLLGIELLAELGRAGEVASANRTVTKLVRNQRPSSPKTPRATVRAESVVVAHARGHRLPKTPSRMTGRTARRAAGRQVGARRESRQPTSNDGFRTLELLMQVPPRSHRLTVWRVIG